MRVPVLALALALLAGCVSTPKPPLPAPATDVRVGYYAGDPIAGATQAEDSLTLDPQTAVPLRARLYFTDAPPSVELAPIAEDLRLILANGGTEPLAARSLLAPGVRFTRGVAAAALAREMEERAPNRAALVHAAEALCAPGVTTSLSASHAQPIDVSTGRPSERRLAVELWHGDGDGLTIALTIDDVVERIEGIAEARPDVARRALSERLVLGAELQASVPLALYVPARFDPSGASGYVLVLRRGQGPIDAEALAFARAALQGAPADAAASGDDDPMLARRLMTLDALGDAKHRRAALVELAGAAPIAGELALLADAELVQLLSERLEAQAEELRAQAGDADLLAWRVEREAIGLLAGRAASTGLPPEHQALLMRHTGEAGRYPGALQDALAASAALSEFEERMLTENRLALEDTSPAARVRATDWLAARGVAIPDYDPLGERAQRRAALRAWMRAAERASSEEQAPR